MHAIVGKNGCGKSTLLEILYIIINNFAYLFERGRSQIWNKQLYFVPGLYANMYYSENNDEYCLSCQDKEVVLIKNERDLIRLRIQEKGGVCELSPKEIAYITQNFFFTIVSNYSPQSFVSFNYLGRVYKYRDGIDVPIIGEWINGVFHRNDGYIRSIVINPYRNAGVFDAGQEIKLSKERISSVLIYAKQSKESSIVGYSYGDMVISRKKGFLVEKLRTFYNRCEEENEYFRRKFRNDADVLSVMGDDFCAAIIEVFGFKNRFRTFIELVSLAYLQIKIFSILNNYNEFRHFTKCVNFDNDKFVVNDMGLLKQYLRSLCSDCSHTTTKIRRALYFLTLDETLFRKLDGGKIRGQDYWSNIKDRNFKNKQNWGGVLSLDYENFVSPAAVIDCLPPSFLNYELILENESKVKINYRLLSSGESQMMQTLSIHAYHIENLLSIRLHNAEYDVEALSNAEKPILERRPEYTRVNLIFDEVELCFHPDYQRRFLYELIRMIKSMRHNKTDEYDGLYINIIFVTHSPFVLSDIPQSNILYLKKGAVANECINKNPFAANVNDILHQSFFMEDGFTGEFAKRKINLLVDWLISKGDIANEDKWTIGKANCFVEKYVGEPLLKNCLKKMLGEKNEENFG